MVGKTWRVLLSVAFVLLVICAVRAVRRPAASEGAQRTVARVDRAHASEAAERMEAVSVGATNDLQSRQWEAAGAAQRIEQQEAAAELQRRQQEGARPPAENRGISPEAAGS